MPELSQTPAPGETMVRFVGDRIAFALRGTDGDARPGGWRAFLRTNLGRGTALRAEIVAAVEEGKPGSLASWRDIPLIWKEDAWRIELPLTEVGWFEAKAYAVDTRGWQHWPAGENVGVSVQPAECRTANTLYCAFTRMFGPGKTAASTVSPAVEAELRRLDEQGYTVIPPSGTLRDLGRELPHIFDRLGCRILHLLPIHPTPTTFARFGRYGSPYACQDLLAIDPALIEFDRRTTGLDQFRELAHGVHARGGRLFLDIVINHTGWGSTLWENRPGWFERHPDGRFKSPGAWGNTWEDLVELRHDHPELRRYLAEALLEWCRRGVDGFRCDAGYMVPLDVWRYLVARVRQEFPDTVFLLEGLGGSWEATERLLMRGNLQWAYSELFQNYTGSQVAWYLDYALEQSRRAGLYVHYSETHDNDRLAARGRDWSLLRNRLCALTSVCGGYGFTTGVEWLAAEKINVHSSRGLAWGSERNLVRELGGLNRLLAEHPCFFDGATVTRSSANEAPVLVLTRISAEGRDRVLVLVNTDPDHEQTARLGEAVLREAGLVGADGDQVEVVDLLEQDPPAIRGASRGVFQVALAPAAAFCLAARGGPLGRAGAAYREQRALETFALETLANRLPVEALGTLDLGALADWVRRDVVGYLAAVARLTPASAAEAVVEQLKPAPDRYAPVIRWQRKDCRRVTVWPADHWLLVEDEGPFRVTLRGAGVEDPRHGRSVALGDRQVAAFWIANRNRGGASIELDRYGDGERRVEGRLWRVDERPSPDPAPDDRPDIVLLTNGIGGMARMPADWGAIRSKYDCVLAANLHPRAPVDRHVFVKRARVWVNAHGFLSPLDPDSLVGFEPGPPVIWRFLAPAGDGRTVEIQVDAAMVEGRNTTVLRIHRPAAHGTEGRDLPAGSDVRLTVRLDLEDRNFHQETRFNPEADRHFRSHISRLANRPGFQFRPAPDRGLRVEADAGTFHPEPEWCFQIPHPVEASRGQVAGGDAFSPGWFEIPLPGGATITLVLSADPESPGSAEVEASLAPVRQNSSPASGEQPRAADCPWVTALRRAARAFLVRRHPGRTVIAGYPWFLDWGRDTLIAARGLLAAGWETEVAELLKVYGRLEEHGTLPNAIHGDDAGNRETSDAPLWYAVVAGEYAARTGVRLSELCLEPGGRTVAEVLRSIARGYWHGTPNQIRVDRASGLVWSPAHFTWMDTNHPAGTPREGYPVEIQVLWIQLLRQLEQLGAAPLDEAWSAVADRARAAFESLFWIESKGWLADVLLAPRDRAAAEAQPQDALRSNGLLAVSLGLLHGARARRLVEAARRWLVVPGALRSLAPLRVTPPLPVRAPDGRLLNVPEEPYWGRYEGDEDTRRKPAYHNGTAWTWTFPVFAEALVRAWDGEAPAVAAARAYLSSGDRLLAGGCAGQLPEVVDGDAPHTQRGCDAQAWGVTELLRVWLWLDGVEAGRTPATSPAGTGNG